MHGPKFNEGMFNTEQIDPELIPQTLNYDGDSSAASPLHHWMHVYEVLASLEPWVHACQSYTDNVDSPYSFVACIN